MNYDELTNLITAGEQDTIIAELKNNRLTAVPNVAESRRQIDPTLHKVMDKQYRPDKEINVRGKNNEIERRYTEPVGRSPLALQSLIVKRAVAFLFGNPVKLTADTTETDYTSVLSAVKRVFADVKENPLNREVARCLMTYKEVAEYWYIQQGETADRYGFPSENKIRVSVFSAEHGDVLYPFFDDNKDLIAFSREYSVSKGSAVTTYFETYTKDYLYKWQTNDGTTAIVDGYPKPNILGKIPIVYAYQPKTEWADVQTLIERLELLLSNFADTNDYHASPKIFCQGKINGFSKKAEQGTILQGDPGSTVQYLTWNQAPESVRLEIDTLLKMIYTISQTPDISFDNVKGIGAISGTALRLLFMDSHLKVQEKSEIFEAYLQRRVNIVLAFLSKMNLKDADFTQKCKNIIITPEIQPYMIEDDTTKIANIAAAKAANIISPETGVSRLNWVKDVNEEIEKINADRAAESVTDLMTPME